MICPKDKCTGCFACVNKCPKSCIEMIPDELGHIYPKIDDAMCIHCDLCKKVCPSNHPLERNLPVKALASWSKSDTMRSQSTSGGLAATLSKYIIRLDGIVYGVAFRDGMVRHIRVDNEEGLDVIKGSKYVHSYVMDTFKSVLKDIKEDKIVLYTGTPCQIAGLKAYLGKDYKNLFLVDIVCHGVPSQQLLKEELKTIKSYDRVSFRDSKGYNLTAFFKNKILLKKPQYESFYFSAFLNGLTFRENCYTCSYANSKRIGDLTLGDFWGLGDLRTADKEEDKGISLVLINTEKGKQLIKSISNFVFLEERDIQEAIDGNDQLRHPSNPHKNKKMFEKNYLETRDYVQSMEAALEWYSIKQRMRRMVLRSDIAVSIIKKIKK